MKKELTISERGQVSMNLKSNENFYTDLKLYNKHFGGSKLSIQLTKVNEMNIDSLHGRMLYELLSKVDEEDIINNRLTPIQLAAKKKAENAAKKAQLKADEADKKEAELKAKQDASGASTNVVPPVEGAGASADVVPPIEGAGASTNVVPPIEGAGASADVVPPIEVAGASADLVPPVEGPGTSDEGEKKNKE